MYGYNTYRKPEILSWKNLVKTNQFWISHEMQFWTTVEEEINTFSLSVSYDAFEREVLNGSSDGEDLLSLFKPVLDKMKTKAGYSESSISIEPVDYYEYDTDSYTMPYFNHKKGQRKLEVQERTLTHIPKGWSIDLKIKFDKPLTMRTRQNILKLICEEAGLEFKDTDKKRLEQGYNIFVANRKRPYSSWVIFSRDDETK